MQRVVVVPEVSVPQCASLCRLLVDLVPLCAHRFRQSRIAQTAQDRPCPGCTSALGSSSDSAWWRFRRSWWRLLASALLAALSNAASFGVYVLIFYFLIFTRGASITG